jgi:hypothetical protein
VGGWMDGWMDGNSILLYLCRRDVMLHVLVTVFLRSGNLTTNSITYVFS